MQHKIVATAECSRGCAFTEIDAESASDSQKLVLTLLAMHLRGTVIGKWKSLFEYPLPPTDERITSALSLVNSLAVTGTSSKDVIAKLFEATAYTINT